MLQIVTGMYFDKQAEMHPKYIHRDIFYTNVVWLPRETLRVANAELAPTTSTRSTTSTVAVAITEQLPATYPDGSPSIQLASGGTELLDDLAAVLSFALNALFTRDSELVRRSVPVAPGQAPGRDSPARVLVRMYDPGLSASLDDIEDTEALISDLLALSRKRFEAAMRAIRRVVGASGRAGTNISAAYTDIVAALESLADEGDFPRPDWQRLDGAKRKLFDKALVGVPEEAAESVRQAVLAAEHAGASHRFISFTVNHVEDSYYEAEAIGTLAPPRARDLERMLRWAYNVRSQQVHALVEIPGALSWVGPKFETFHLGSGERVLTLQGLFRLARHVIRTYVARSEKGVDPTFSWPEAIPGVVTVRLAAQYWIDRLADFTPEAAPERLNGLLEIWLALGRRELATIPDLRPILSAAEHLVKGRKPDEQSRALLALYVIWDAVVVDDLRLETARAFLKKQRSILSEPNLYTWLISFVTGDHNKLALEQLLPVAEERWNSRSTRTHQPLPAEFDALLQASVASGLIDAGRFDEAHEFADRAIKELPGNAAVIEWRTSVLRHEAHPLSVQTILEFAEAEDSE